MEKKGKKRTKKEKKTLNERITIVFSNVCNRTFVLYIVHLTPNTTMIA